MSTAKCRSGSALLTVLLLITAVTLVVTSSYYISYRMEGVSGARLRTGQADVAAKSTVDLMTERLATTVALKLGNITQADIDSLNATVTSLPAPSGATIDAGNTGFRVTAVRDTTPEGNHLRLPTDEVPIATWTHQPRNSYDATPPVGGMAVSRSIEITVYATVRPPQGGTRTAAQTVALALIPPYQSALYTAGDAEVCAAEGPGNLIAGQVHVDGTMSVGCRFAIRYIGGVEARDAISAAAGSHDLITTMAGSGAANIPLSTLTRAAVEANPSAAMQPWGGRIRITSALGGPLNLTRFQTPEVAGFGECLDLMGNCGGRSHYSPGIELQRQITGTVTTVHATCWYAVTSWPQCIAWNGAHKYTPWPFAAAPAAGTAAADPGRAGYLWKGLLFDARRETRCNASSGGNNWRTARCPSNAYGYTLDLSKLTGPIPGGFMSYRKAINQVAGANPSGAQEILLIKNARALPQPLTIVSEIPVFIEGQFNITPLAGYGGPPPAMIQAPRITVIPDETDQQLATSAVWDSVPPLGSPTAAALPLQAVNNVTIYAVLRTGYCRTIGGTYYGGSWEAMPSVLGDWSSAALRVVGAVEGYDETSQGAGYCSSYGSFGATAASGTPTIQPLSRNVIFDDRLLNTRFQPPGSFLSANTPPAGWTGTSRTPARQQNAFGGLTVLRIVKPMTVARASTVASSVSIPPLPTLGPPPPILPIGPTAYFTFVANLLDVSFDATGSTDGGAPPLAYSWDFGDGTSGTGATPSHSYPNGQDYTATLTVTNGIGRTSRYSRVLALNRPPVASFTASPNPTNPVAAPVTFTSTSTDPDGNTLVATWDYGDGTTGTGTTTSHAYSNIGTFTAKLTVDDGRGGVVSTTKTITVVDFLPGVITPPANQSQQPGTTNTVTFTIRNPNYAICAYTLTATSSNPAVAAPTGDPTLPRWLNPGESLTFTLTYVVADPANAAGSQATLTVNSMDQRIPALVSSGSFVFTTAQLLRNPVVIAPAAATVHPNGSYTYSAQVTNASNAARTLNITVGNNLDTYYSLTATPGSSLFQPYETKTVQYTVAVRGDAPDGHQNNIVITAQDAGAGSYSGSATQSLTVQDRPPVPSFTVTPNPTYNDQTITADGSASTDPDGTGLWYNYNWGDGASTGYQLSATATHRYANPGTYTVTLTTADPSWAAGSGYAISTTRTVTILNRNPVACLVVRSATVYRHVVINGDPSCSSDPDGQTLTNTWNWGDGTINTGYAPTHSYNSIGDFTVTLTVNDGFGGRDSTTGVVHVVDMNPTAAFTATPNPTDNSTTVTFDGRGSSDGDGDLLTYSWAFGDGTTATGSTTTHRYATVGTFLATLTVSDGFGGSNSISYTITVANRKPVACATPISQNAVMNVAVSFSGACSSDPDGQALVYSWLYGDGATGSGMTVSHAYTTRGSKSVRLVVKDGAGLADTTYVTVAVQNQPPTASFTYSPNSGIVAGTTVSFNGAASSDPDGDPLTLTWNFGDGSPTANGTTTTHAFSRKGSYTVTLTVNDGITNTTTSQTITVGNTAPTASFTLSPTIGDMGTTFTVTSTSVDVDGDGMTYTWSWGDGSPNSTGLSATHVYTSRGAFTIMLIASDGTASGTATRNLTITNRPPTACFTLSTTSTETYLPVTIDATCSSDPDGDVLSYDIDYGDGSAHGTANPVSKSYANPGTYTVTVLVNDGHGGSNSTSKTVTVAPGLHNPTVTGYSNTSLNPSTVYTAVYQVTNNSTTTRTFDFTATSSNGAAAVIQGTPGNTLIAAGSTSSVSVTYQVPAGSLGGAASTITLTAIDHSAPSYTGSWSFTQTTNTVYLPPTVTTPDGSALYLTPGAYGWRQADIRNNSNVTQTYSYSLAVTPNGIAHFSSAADVADHGSPPGTCTAAPGASCSMALAITGDAGGNATASYSAVPAAGQVGGPVSWTVHVGQPQTVSYSSGTTNPKIDQAGVYVAFAVTNPNANSRTYTWTATSSNAAAIPLTTSSGSVTVAGGTTGYAYVYYSPNQPSQSSTISISVTDPDLNSGPVGASTSVTTQAAWTVTASPANQSATSAGNYSIVWTVTNNTATTKTMDVGVTLGWNGTLESGIAWVGSNGATLAAGASTNFTLAVTVKTGVAGTITHPIDVEASGGALYVAGLAPASITIDTRGVAPQVSYASGTLNPKVDQTALTVTFNVRNPNADSRTYNWTASSSNPTGVGITTSSGSVTVAAGATTPVAVPYNALKGLQSATITFTATDAALSSNQASATTTVNTQTAWLVTINVNPLNATSTAWYNIPIYVTNNTAANRSMGIWGDALNTTYENQWQWDRTNAGIALTPGQQYFINLQIQPKTGVNGTATHGLLVRDESQPGRLDLAPAGGTLTVNIDTRNQPPTATVSCGSGFAGENVFCSMAGTDPDGDALTPAAGWTFWYAGHWYKYVYSGTAGSQSVCGTVTDSKGATSPSSCSTATWQNDYVTSSYTEYQSVQTGTHQTNCEQYTDYSDQSRTVYEWASGAETYSGWSTYESHSDDNGPVGGGCKYVTGSYTETSSSLASSRCSGNDEIDTYNDYERTVTTWSDGSETRSGWSSTGTHTETVTGACVHIVSSYTVEWDVLYDSYCPSQSPWFREDVYDHYSQVHYVWSDGHETTDGPSATSWNTLVYDPGMCSP